MNGDVYIGDDLHRMFYEHNVGWLCLAEHCRWEQAESVDRAEAYAVWIIDHSEIKARYRHAEWVAAINKINAHLKGNHD